ncbi:MAG: RluA family pseudouridine synthase [Gemmatimonadetes bacterium]|nr:RluA family pseudouridine synthase [Gemmatimonadota bacterium]
MARATEAMVYRLEVAADAAERLDVWLAARLEDLSRTRIAGLIDQGRVLVNGRVVKKRDRPRAGDVIVLSVPPLPSSDVVPEAIPLSIVYEDDDILVVDKPAGMVVHPAAGNPVGTLANALVHHFGQLPGTGAQRPGIVHRLDKDTSGLLLVARTELAHRRLSGMLKRRAVRRVYIAAAWGHLPREEMTIDAPLGRSTADRRRVTIVPDGKPAVTHARRVERWAAADLLEVRLESGRTHQIRVHLLSVGHPVVGDRVYAAGAERGMSGPFRAWARELARRVPRQFLHAARLSLAHPISGEALEFDSALPADLAEAGAWARETSGGQS